jgi:hypothetical protein
MASVRCAPRGAVLPALTVGLLSIFVLSGCGSSSPSASAPTTPDTTAPATSPTTTAPPASGGTATTVGATTTVPTVPAPSTTVVGGTTAVPATGTAQNLVVTDELRAQLVQAAETTEELPAGSYTGLAPGMTYYAYDPATGRYYAGAGLVPSSASQEAQVSVQDDGSYHLFTRVGTSGTWDDHDVGLSDTPGATCPVTVPAAVLAVWGWPAGTCAAPGT